MLSLSKGQKALIRPGLFAQFLHSDDPALSAAKTFSRDYVNTPCSWAPPLPIPDDVQPIISINSVAYYGSYVCDSCVLSVTLLLD